MPMIEDLINGIYTKNSDGSVVKRFLSADNVKSADGKTVEQHVANAALHLTQANIDAAVGLVKDGADGSALSADYASLKKTGEAVEGLKSALNAFLQGENDGGEIDRLIELVAAIGANKDSIDALMADKVEKTDIVDALTSAEAGKALSAAQGKVIKGLLDDLDGKIDGAVAGIETRAWVKTVDSVPDEWPADAHPGGMLLLVPAAPEAPETPDTQETLA